MSARLGARAPAVQPSLVVAALLLACFSAVVVAPPPPSFTCDAGNDVAVCAILAEFYNATGGSSWSGYGGWRTAAAGTATNYCGFTGNNCVGGNISQMCVS